MIRFNSNSDSDPKEIQNKQQELMYKIDNFLTFIDLIEDQLDTNKKQKEQNTIQNDFNYQQYKKQQQQTLNDLEISQQELHEKISNLLQFQNNSYFQLFQLPNGFSKLKEGNVNELQQLSTEELIEIYEWLIKTEKLNEITRINSE